MEVTDLAAPADGASLFVGEFVEYLPSAAQQAVEAAAQGGGAERPTGWVRGLMGWPLMCQAVGQGAEVATSTAMLPQRKSAIVESRSSWDMPPWSVAHGRPCLISSLYRLSAASCRPTKGWARFRVRARARARVRVRVRVKGWG